MLSILGIIGVLPLIGSIGGIISGQIARREIQENPGQYGGEDLARAGVILGWVGVAIGLVALCLLVVGLLFFLPLGFRTF